MAEAGRNSQMLATKSIGNVGTETEGSNGHVNDVEATIVATRSGTKDDEYVVDIDKWAASLAGLLEDVPHYMCNPGHPGRISRIPENIREVDAKSYEPYFMSVGPYHHGTARVERIEKRKRVVLKCFLEQNPEINLKDYLYEITRIEPAARSFYSNIEMDSENFVQMLLLDSFYIVIILCGMPPSGQKLNPADTRIGTRIGNDDTVDDQINEDMGNETDDHITDIEVREDDSIYGTRSQDKNVVPPRWFGPLLSHDLFLLENQLPFFVLEKMYEIVYGGPKAELMGIMRDTVRNMLMDYTKQDSEMVIPPTEEVHHLLHLGHMFFRPTIQQESTTSQLLESNQMFRLGNAVQLYEAGVHFEARSDSSHHSLLDITFGSSGNMVMPCLNVDDNTIALLRNLIALEQMKYPSLGLNVSAYAVLLLHLVTIPKDVALLRRKGIIQHHLASDKEMMYLINRLSVGLSLDYLEDEYSLKPVFQELKRYTEHRVPRWKAWLRHRYFYNPWTVISLLAASLLLLLSFIQTYYTVYSYLRPCCDGHT